MNAEINWEQLSLVVGDENEPADEEMVDLYRLFVDDAGQRLGRIVAPEGPLDLTFVAKEAHKIRGAASSFGFDRVAFGGDWPVSELATRYADWVATLDRVVAGSSDADLRKLYRDNAMRFYRL